jgi:hypothetical protein
VRETALDAVPQDVVDDYVEINLRPHKLKNFFAVNINYMLIGKQESNSYFGNWVGINKAFL